MLFKIGSFLFRVGLALIGLAVLASFGGMFLHADSPAIPVLLTLSGLMGPAGGVAFVGILIKEIKCSVV